jgi:2-polyprenyl-6-hydroxyphenyl methylase/3-demethylubiquinone-9 3-methyltransferase
MSIYYDVIDWLGGYPYEYASFEEMKNFVEKLGFQLVRAPVKIPSPKKTLFNQFTLNFTGNNQFIFRKL